MRILFTMTPPFDPNSGGVQRTTYKLGKYFNENGLSVAYFSLANEGHISVDFGKLYKVEEGNGEKNNNNLKFLKSVLVEFQPDFVINQMPYVKELRETLDDHKNLQNFILLGCLRNSLFNFKSNVRDRMQQILPKMLFRLLDNPIGIGFVKFRHRINHSKDLKSILDQHDRFILLAPPNRDELQYFVGDYKKDKVLSIPNSIPEIVKNKEAKEKIILHVGRLNVAQKRSDLLADFWENTYKILPDWKFIIIGDGPYQEKLEEEIHMKGLTRMELLGYQKPENYYKRASVFMMPSAFEGFPNTILEAQSYGCIPLAFNSYAALPWIVNDKKDALLSPAFDTKDMAEKFVDLGQNEQKLNIMKQAAYENAEKFTIDKVGEIWLQLFDNMSDTLNK